MRDWKTTLLCSFTPYSHVIIKLSLFQTVTVGTLRAVIGDVSKCFKLTAPRGQPRDSTAEFIWSFWQKCLGKVSVLRVKTWKVSISFSGSKEVASVLTIPVILSFSGQTLRPSYSSVSPVPSRTWPSVHVCRHTHTHTHTHTHEEGYDWERGKNREQVPHAFF
jgi:hypothetical protein